MRVETFDMPVWVRGEERAQVVSPFPQPLVMTALGNSGATPARGLEAEVIGYASMAAFRAAPETEVRGKIVFVSHAMQAAQDGSGYGPFGAARRRSWSARSAPIITATRIPACRASAKARCRGVDGDAGGGGERARTDRADPGGGALGL